MSGYSRAWLKLPENLPDLPEAGALGRRLGEPFAWARLILVWIHFLRFAPAGRLLGTEDNLSALESAARWAGEPGALVRHFLELDLLRRKGRWIHVWGWDEWQSQHIEKAAQDRQRMRLKRADSREESRATIVQPSPDGPGERRQEEKREETTSAPSAALSTPPALRLIADEPSSPVVAVFPCVGKGPHEYAVTEARCTAWAPAFPGVDVRGEVRQMAVWLEANPRMRKTVKGVPRFVVSWLSREQDKGRPAAVSTPAMQVLT